MLDVLRTDRIRLTLEIVDYADQTSAEVNVFPSRGDKTAGRPNQFVYLRTTLLNQSGEFLSSYYFIILAFDILTISGSSILDCELNHES